MRQKNDLQNIVISTYGITAEQTKMIEAFAMFQKFMNFTPEMNKQIMINNNNIPNTSPNSNNIFTNNININNTNNNYINNNINHKQENFNIVENKSSERKWQPLKRNKSKNIEKIDGGNSNKFITNKLNDNIEIDKNDNVIKSTFTSYKYKSKKALINENKNISDKEIEPNEKIISKVENNPKSNLINFDDIPIKTIKNSIVVDLNKNIDDNTNINKIAFNKQNKNININNIDDIIIKPSTSNFMELLEKNLQNNNIDTNIKNNNITVNINENNNKKKAKKEVSNMKINLLDNYDPNDPYTAKILKQEKIKQNKEKAKEIEKKIHLNGKNNQSIDIKNPANTQKKSSKKIFDFKIDNNPIKLDNKIQNKWSKAKFNLLNDENNKNEELDNNNTPKNISLLKNKYNFKTLDINNNININNFIYNIDKYNKRLNDYQKEKLKLENEKEKVKKLKEDYDKLNQNLCNEIQKHKNLLEHERINFESFKSEQIKTLNKEKKELSNEQKILNEIRIKYQINNKQEIKNKNELDQIKNKLIKQQKEASIKEKTDRIIIEKYKNELIEKENEIQKLIYILNTNYNINIDNSENNVENNNNEIENNEEEENYDLLFPREYHNANYNLIKSETTNDGKIINYYDQNKKEIIFKSGVKKENYGDEYQIIYFTNGDIKQVFVKLNKQVYFFKDKNIVQTTIGDKCQIIKYENGQIEKKFKDGTKQICYPDGIIKNKQSNVYGEIYYPDGRNEKINEN